MYLYKITDAHKHEFHDPSDRQYIYYERYGNGGTRGDSAMARRIDVDLLYQPGNPRAETYAVPRLLVDNSDRRISIYSATDSPELMDLVMQGDRVWMHVFPQFYTTGNDAHLQWLRTASVEQHHLTVVPTSSCRTVMDVASKTMIKMHCPYVITRFDRSLGTATIQHCITLTKELKTLLGTGAYPRCAILPDAIGAAFNDPQGWGYIVRESTPWPPAPVDEKRTMVSMFALYGADVLDPTTPPLITKMIDQAYAESHSSNDKKTFARQFVLEEIISPLVDFFIAAYRERGILLELHGQNTLIELNAKGLPTRIVHRDFDNAVDIDVRIQKGLSLEGLYEGQLISCADADKEPGSEQSIIFDRSIGLLNLDLLAECLEAQYGIPTQELEQATAAHFATQFPDFRAHFPRDLAAVYRYAPAMRADQYNSYDVVRIPDDTARWRPAN